MKAQQTYQAPPCNPDAEQAVLGLCEENPAAFFKAHSLIGERDPFFVKEHSKIWKAYCAWYEMHPNDPVDFCWFREYVKCDHDVVSMLSGAGNMAAIRRATTPNLPYYTDEILKTWRQRKSRDLAGLLARAVDANDEETAEAVRRDLAELNADFESTSLLNPQSVLDAGDPPPVVFRGGMVEGALGILAAVDGIGKSMLALDIALSVSTLHPVIPSLRRYTKTPGNVMVLSYEDSRENIKRRLYASAEHSGMVQEMKQAFDENRLHFYFPETPVFTQIIDGMIVPTPLFHEVDREAARIKPALIIFDPYSAVSTSPENDNNAGAQVGQHLSALAGKHDCGVLVLHHVAKSRVDDDGHLAMRGNTGLPSKARWIARLLTVDGDHDRLRLHFAKDSYNQRIDDVFFQRTLSGALKELTRESLGAELDALRSKVVDFIANNPDLKISKNAVRLNNSKAAKVLIDSLNASPAQIYDAIVSALKAHYLSEETWKKSNGYEQKILVCQSFDDYEEDDSEMPF